MPAATLPAALLIVLALCALAYAVDGYLAHRAGCRMLRRLRAVEEGGSLAEKHD